MVATVGCAIVATWLLACDHDRWHVGPRVRARDTDIAAALGDTASQASLGLEPADIPNIAFPRALRPCCAFGVDLKVELHQVLIPGVELANIVDPDDLGRHRYDNGYVSMRADDPRGIVDDERNGLVYTCRGGFIDLAHVRDNADNTVAMAAALARALETGTAVTVPPQGATIRIRLRPVPPDAIRRHDRMQLAVAGAEWAAYQLSVWHEIATFYGYAALPQWPEKISAFSPEDLYSNQLGVRIAGAIILAKQAASDLEYDVSMDAWIAGTLKRLAAVPPAASRAAMRAVDGLWWDSAKRIPDWTLVRRRQFETVILRPWRIEDTTPGARDHVAPPAACRDEEAPLALQVADGFAGVPFRDHLTVEVDVDDALLQAGFPLPHRGARRVTQEDFPTIIDAIRAENARVFGAGADVP
jgi:hypothetical protein